jgi:divalent metal cation (Fe/Co/Zn/Cd) transporter
VSPVELPILAAQPSSVEQPPSVHDDEWLRIARRARALSWASLAWMTVEGVVGMIAGFDANALSVIVWAASSFVEGLASMIVIWRFSGSRTLSEHSERTAQRLVAGSFLLLIPFFMYEAGHRMLVGSEPSTSALGIAVTGSAIVLMPALGWAKLRLGERLGSGATTGEGVQNLMCAAQAAAALIALLGAAAGLGIIDPIAAVVVASIAAKESVELWQGSGDDCCAPVGLSDPAREKRCVPGCDCC